MRKGAKGCLNHWSDLSELGRVKMPETTLNVVKRPANEAHVLLVR
jgi:hypothetical protein